MVELPKRLLDMIEHLGVTSRQYIDWVAGHEASHVVIALLISAFVDEISLVPIESGDSFSLARAIWRPGAAQNDRVLWAIAAGPAFDDRTMPILAPQTLPSDLSAATEFVRLKLPDITNGHIEELWRAAMVKADQLLDNPRIAKARSAIQACILSAIDEDRESISGHDVLEVLTAHPLPSVDDVS